MANANIGTAEGRLVLRDEFIAVLKRSSDALAKHGAKMQQVGRHMSDIGGQLTRTVTLPVAALGGVAIKSFADFDAAMNQSLAIMGDVSDSMRGEMSTAAREMAKETVFSAKQAAESYFFLASAGLDAESSVAALPRVAKFAQAGMFDMALATDLLTDAQSALGLAIRDDAIANMEQMTRVADVLVRANTLANATVEQFSTSLTREAGAALKSMNKDVEEGVAVLAAFADQGVKGEVAGSGLSRIIRLMSKAALDNAEAYKRLNVSVFDAQGNMRNFADIIGDLENAFADLSPKQRAAELANLGFQARVQGVILPLLGTSEAIRNYEKELRSASGFTDTVAAKQLQSFSNRMKLLKDRFLDTAITLGGSLAPVLEDFADNVLEPLLGLIDRAVKVFASLPSPIQAAIVAVAALAAAAGPVLLVAGGLVAAWGAVAAAMPAIVSAISGALVVITGPAGWIAAGVATLAAWRPAREFLIDLGRSAFGKLAEWVRKAIDLAREWWASTAEGRQFLLALHEVIRRDVIGAFSSLVEWFKSVVKGQVESARLAFDLARAFLEWSGALDFVKLQIAMIVEGIKAFVRIAREQFERLLEMAGGFEGLAQFITMTNPALGAAMGKLQEWIREARASVEVNKRLSREYESVAESAEELTEWQRRMDEASADVLAEVQEEIKAQREREEQLKEVSEATKEAVKSMVAATAENAALASALTESQEAYDTLNTLLEAGVPLNEALSGAYDDQAEALLKAQAELESLNKLREAEIEHAEKMLDLQMKINAARLKASAQSEFDDRFLGAIDLPDMEPVFPVIDPAALEQMNEDWRNTVGAMSLAMEAMQKRAWENIQDIASNAIAEIIKTGEVDFENLFDSILDVVAQMLAQMLIMWFANLSKRVAAEQAAAAASAAAWASAAAASGGGGGGGAFGLMGNFATTAATGATTTGGAGWMSTLTSLGPVLAVAAAWMVGSYLVERRKEKATGGTVHFGTPTNMGVAFNDDLQMARDMKAVLDQLKATFEEIERVTGASINILEQAVINVKNNGRIWVTIGEQLSVEVASMEEAMDLVVTRLLRSAEISGASDAIMAALKNSVATSVEELQAEVAAALRSEELFLGIEGRTAIREKTNEFFELLEQELALGIIEAQGGSGALVGLVNSYQENFDRLMGITRDAGEVARQQAAAHNAALKMDIARLMAMRAEILATAAAAEAAAGLAGVHAGGTEVMVQMAEVTAANAQVQAEWVEVMLAGTEVANANAQSQAALAQTQAAGAEVALSAAEANAAALAAIDEALAALQGLEVDLDAAAAAARRAARGAGGASPMEQLMDTLDSIDRSLLPPLARQLAELALKYEQLTQQARGNAEALARINDLRRQELELLRQQATENLFGGIRDFEQVGPRAEVFGQLDSIRDQAQELRDQAEEWAAEMAASAEEAGKFFDEAGRLERALDRISAAERRRIEALAKQVKVDLLGGLADMIQDEDLRQRLLMEMEKIRFVLEMQRFRAEFQMLKALGQLTAAQISMIQQAFNWIDNNTDKILKARLPTPRAPGGGGGSGRDEAAEARNRLREILARSLTPFEQAIRRTVDEFAELRKTLGWTAEVQTAYAQEIRRVLMEQLEPIKRLQEDLAFRSGSSMRTIDQFRLAQRQLVEAQKRLAGGDLSALDEIPELARRVLDLNPAAQASEGNRFIEQWVNKILDAAQEAAEGAALGIEPGGANDPFAWLRSESTAGDRAVQQTVWTAGNNIINSNEDIADEIDKANKDGAARDEKRRSDLSNRLAIANDLARQGNQNTSRISGRLETHENLLRSINIRIGRLPDRITQSGVA